MKPPLFLLRFFLNSETNPSYSNFIAALFANSIGFPIKLLTLSKSYSVFIINKKTIALTAILEIIKASISDGTALFLMYTPSFSPLKNNII